MLFVYFPGLHIFVRFWIRHLEIESKSIDDLLWRKSFFYSQPGQFSTKIYDIFVRYVANLAYLNIIRQIKIVYYEITVWKLQTFSVTQILCEIKVDKSV